jgi:hypothetical protein
VTSITVNSGASSSGIALNSDDTEQALSAGTSIGTITGSACHRDGSDRGQRRRPARLIGCGCTARNKERALRMLRPFQARDLAAPEIVSIPPVKSRANRRKLVFGMTLEVSSDAGRRV